MRLPLHGTHQSRRLFFDASHLITTITTQHHRHHHPHPHHHHHSHPQVLLGHHSGQQRLRIMQADQRLTRLERERVSNGTPLTLTLP